MKRKIIIGSFIAVVIIIFVSVYISKNSGSTSSFGGGRVFNARVDTIVKGDISASFSASGIIEATDEIEVYFDTSLKVKKILIKENQKVSKGEKVLELDLGDLNSQLEQLKISRDIQAINIRKIREAYGLKNLDALNTAIAIAKSNLESAQDNYNDIKKNFEDAKEAYEKLEISSDELDAAEKALSSAEISLENAKLNYQSATDNYESTKKANSQTESSRNTDIESQEKNLKSIDLKISDLEKKINQINENANSPIDGVISKISVKEGAYLSTMQPAFNVLNPGKLRVKAGIKEYDVKNVSTGQNVRITGDAIAKGAKVMGKVVSLSPSAKKNVTSNGQETVIEAVISIEESDVELKSGLNVNCEVFTNDKKGVLLADFEMMKEDKDGNRYVYVVDKDNIMHQRQIKLGVNTDMKAEVVSGLSEGDMVIVNPLPNFKEGARVKTTKVVKSEEE